MLQNSFARFRKSDIHSRSRFPSSKPLITTSRKASINRNQKVVPDGCISDIILTGIQPEGTSTERSNQGRMTSDAPVFIQPRMPVLEHLKHRGASKEVMQVVTTANLAPGTMTHFSSKPTRCDHGIVGSFKHSSPQKCRQDFQTTLDSHSRTLKVVNTSTQRSRTLSSRALNINKATLRLKQDPSTASSDLTKMEEEVTVISRPNITSLAGMVEGEASTENQSTIRKNSRSRSHT